MFDDGIDEGHGLRPEVAAPVLPLVILLGEDHAHQADEAGPGGEDAHHRGAALDLLVQTLERVRAAEVIVLKGDSYRLRGKREEVLTGPKQR